MNQFLMMLLIQIFALSALPQEAGSMPGNESGAAEIKSVVEAYHKALAAGDADAAVNLLSEDVIILESGHMENAEEYKLHHLETDMEFSAAVKSKREVIQAVVEGDAGWVISSSTAKGEFRGREINSAGVELMVLSKESGSWEIRAIHWSSRRLK
ncbi:MAG: nuclear transport factor 2 family protein [Candidatus Marinimicrobia bacterium]|nr:nuclear transport factor 2 family protein [Candidatus Neomarinimicrobiota bacterium]